MLSVLPWQQSAWQRCMDMLAHQRLPHALLLTGGVGMGLRHFAQVLSQRLLCHQPDSSGNSCQQCQACQLFAAGSHPDTVLIEPEAEGKQIKVDQVRSLIEYVSLKSFSSSNKIAIVVPAEAMNRSTANALLKTLEEPPEQSMLILVSYRPERLPVTIRSRCQAIEFKPDTSTATLEWLQQQHPDSEYPLELLLKLADGGPMNVASMLEEETFQQRASLLADIMNTRADPVRLAGQWDNLGCERVILWLMRINQDLIRLKLLKEKATITNEDMQDELLKLAERLDLQRLLHFYRFLQGKYQQATASISYNSLSILEEIIIYWNNPTQVPQY